MAVLRRYPVKSMLGEDLPASDVTRGPAGHNRISPLDAFGPQPCAGVYAQVLRPGRIQPGDIARLA